MEEHKIFFEEFGGIQALREGYVWCPQCGKENTIDALVIDGEAGHWKCDCGFEAWDDKVVEKVMAIIKVDYAARSFHFPRMKAPVCNEYLFVS